MTNQKKKALADRLGVVCSLLLDLKDRGAIPWELANAAREAVSDAQIEFLSQIVADTSIKYPPSQAYN